jgi:hypothetical protein
MVTSIADANAADVAVSQPTGGRRENYGGIPGDSLAELAPQHEEEVNQERDADDGDW